MNMEVSMSDCREEAESVLLSHDMRTERVYRLTASTGAAAASSTAGAAAAVVVDSSTAGAATSSTGAAVAGVVSGAADIVDDEEIRKTGERVVEEECGCGYKSRWCFDSGWWWW